jgi:hypothetical protein
VSATRHDRLGANDVSVGNIAANAFHPGAFSITLNDLDSSLALSPISWPVKQFASVLLRKRNARSLSSVKTTTVTPWSNPAEYFE